MISLFLTRVTFVSYTYVAISYTLNIAFLYLEPRD